jgi:alpha-1,3-rhamnosyltransferase
VSDVTERPLVTYILLSFNHAQYVEEAIVSILNQDYDPIELIVIDDGSSDGSVDILRAMQQQHGFELVTQSNSGVAAALNRGFSLARGQYIVPHASDDVSHPGRTKEQVTLLQADSNIGFTVGGIRKISPEGKLLDGWSKSKRSVFTFDDFVTGRGRAIAVSSMYRAEAIQKMGLLDEDQSNEDVQLFWRVTDLGYVCLVDHSVHAVDYRIIPGSLGRGNMILHRESFLEFLEQYRDRPWYRRAIRNGKSELFGTLCEERKLDALCFFARNISSMDFKISVRGFVKLLLPREIVNRIRERF